MFKKKKMVLMQKENVFGRKFLYWAVLLLAIGGSSLTAVAQLKNDEEPLTTEQGLAVETETTDDLKTVDDSNANAVTTTKAVNFDFDGDRKADLAVMSPTTGNWVIQQSAARTDRWVNLGGGTVTKIVPGDYDGDGKVDAAVFRYGVWFIFKSGSGLYTETFGYTNSIPVPGDFDGDRKTDLAVFTNGIWEIKQSSTGRVISYWNGTVASKPVVADFSGDGKDDLVVFDNGTWRVMNSVTKTVTVTQFGQTNDIPVPADYDGDHKADFAICRKNGSLVWQIRQSSNNALRQINYGLASIADQPVPADYDGDGKADIAFFRSSNQWSILQSRTNTTRTAALGIVGDLAVESAFIR